MIANPDREPPWIVAAHTLDDVHVARWPGRLWCAEVLDPLDPQNHRGNYTTCVSVRIIEELKTEILFGKFGAKVEGVLKFAATLTLPMAERLAGARSEHTKKITSDGLHRWMAKIDAFDRDPDKDLSGVVAIGGGSLKSPIGCGLSRVHSGVWDAAKREVGEAAIEEGENDIWLTQPWSDAAGALVDAAWAFGAPELFDELEIETLLQGWNQRGPV